ncbi:uncharacterized protein LOC126721777 [Quercus robur]|uniref:uncharacterized protein LOC126721777 n=1 Tax=Quercus robur TaxID=38942 RepID=UPI002161CE69|nr:uncharacterized protein LOC126721777 [Quercus robur]
MSVAQLPAVNDDRESKRAKGMASPVLGFSDEDKIRTIQPHDDALVVTFRIGEYDIERIRLPIQTGSDIVEVDFIVVDAYSPYTAIVARPWLHALGAVSSTLHQRVKYSSEGQVKEIVGDQAMARQCMVYAISQRPSAEPPTHTENPL